MERTRQLLNLGTVTEVTVEATEINRSITQLEVHSEKRSEHTGLESLHFGSREVTSDRKTGGEAGESGLTGAEAQRCEEMVNRAAF